MCSRLRGLLAVLLAGAAVVLGAAPLPAAAAVRPSVVIHATVWDAGERGSWSAFQVRVSSRSRFSGELLVVPARSPSPGAAASPLRTPLLLEAGVERLVTVMVPVGEIAYRAEVRDQSGELVVAGQPQNALAGRASNVGLLSDRPIGELPLDLSSQRPMRIFRQFRSAAEFPSDELLLDGLDAIVIADFDSGALSGEQRQALVDFVALGGALVIAGGDGAGRTVGPLPEPLVPLRPDSTAIASVAPLADLVNETAGDVTTVITGPLRSGRVAVGGFQGLPLIVEAPYGLGRIVQLTYDPFVLAERASTRTLRLLGFSVGLSLATGYRDHPAILDDRTDDRLGKPWTLLDQVPAPRGSKGGPAGLLLLGYPLAMGGAVFLLGRRRGRARRWLAVPGLAGIVTVAMLPVAWGLRASPLTGDEITIERVGSAATPTRVESFHRLVGSARDDHVLRLPRGTSAVAAPAPRPPLALPEGIPFERDRPPLPLVDVLLDGDTRIELTHLRGWGAARLHTLALSGAGGWLEAHLRLQAGRVVGTITNRGERPLRRMRVQSGDGTQAEVVADLPPGATLPVDAPLRPSGQPPPGAGLKARVLDVAASRAEDLGPGELVLVGLVSDQPSLATQKGYRPATVQRAVLTTVALEAADDFALVRQPDGSTSGELDFGVPKAVCCGGSGRGIGVYELRLPTGMAGPFTIEPRTPMAIAQGVPFQAAIYDWASGTWRQLSPGTQAAVAPAEIDNGFVRIRLPAGLPPDAPSSVATASGG